MELIDRAGEWRRLVEHYRQLTDDELVDLARQPSALTDIAQQALQQEVANRRLKIPPEEPPRGPEPSPDVPEGADDPYAADRELIQIATVWSLRDALKLERLLDSAGIPFYMGPEKATSADAVTSNFADGVGVQIMQAGLSVSGHAMKDYFPKDEPPEAKAEASEELAIHCPKCHSTEVVFEELDPEPAEADGKPSSKFKWRCDLCGNEWEDEGVETEE
jgi:DNA-directed RNA polymerase subunit M/transcription elongation factor TFIIS